MFNILVTGSNGQLGSEIKSLHVNYPYNFLFVDKRQLDITHKDAIEKICNDNDINCIINCAAYTAVDKAEDEKEIAKNINHHGVKNLAQIAKKNDISFIHISTDYVFDGKNYRPYIEEDKTNPQGIYGQTKLDGENAIFSVNPKNTIILRTSWVYSSFGNNFVKTILKLSNEKESLNIIFDQIGTPTYAKDLARLILEILPQIKNQTPQIYNFSNEGVCSWYDFAKEIVAYQNSPCTLSPITTNMYPTKAKRPHFSVLDKSKIKNVFDVKIPYWKDSLYECLGRLGLGI